MHVHVVAGHSDVEDASSHTAFVADNPLDLLGEFGFCLRARRRRNEGGFGERQRLPDPLRHLHLVAAADEMDVHDPRILMQEMVMEGR